MVINFFLHMEYKLDNWLCSGFPGLQGSLEAVFAISLNCKMSKCTDTCVQVVFTSLTLNKDRSGEVKKRVKLWHNQFIVFPSISVTRMFIVVVQSFSCVQPFATPRTVAHQASPSFTITHSLLKRVSFISDAFQPSHPLSPPPAVNLSQHQGLFQLAGSSHQVAKVLEPQLQHQSFQWVFRTEFF